MSNHLTIGQIEELVTAQRAASAQSAAIMRAAAVEESLRAMGLEGLAARQVRAADFEDWRIIIEIDGERREHLIPAEHRTLFAERLIAFLEAGGWTDTTVLREQLKGTRKDNSNMSTSSTPPVQKPATGETVKTFASEVAYRTAAIQLTKRMRGMLADALTQHLRGKARANKRQLMLDLLDGPAGGPLVAMLLSGLLPQAAQLLGQKSDKIERLTNELRLHAGVIVTSELIDGIFALLGPAKEMLTQALAALPEAPALDSMSAPGVLFDAAREQVAARAMTRG